MRRILSTALAELRISVRNRWVAIALLLMAVFSLVLTLAGSAPTGGIGADALEWVAEDRFDKIQDAQGGLALCFDPVAQVVPEFRLEYGTARPTPQGRPRLSIPGACRPLLHRPGRGARP